jgi:protein-S-isoprenylcysteine O-methyltransferase Ste14
MVWFVASFILWAVVHSITAAAGFKAAMRRLMGDRAYDGWYRLLYNLFATVTFLPVLYFLVVLVPKTPLWVIPRPYSYVANLVQLLGFLGLLLALWQTDVWEFIGLRQALRYLTRQSEPAVPAQLVTSGTYALMRHPLYFFSLLIIWFTPGLTLDRLALNVVITLYFWIGAYYEERRLAANFGEAYREYQRRVPYLLPFKLVR